MEVTLFMDADGNIQGLLFRVLKNTAEGNSNTTEIAILVLLFVLFIVGGGYFGGSESAFSAMNKIRIKSKADNGDKKAKNAMHVANNFEKALTTLLIGNNITHIAAASVATLIFTKLFGMSDAGQWICTFVTTFIVFLFSEMIPKSFAKKVLSYNFPLVFIPILYNIPYSFSRNKKRILSPKK